MMEQNHKMNYKKGPEQHDNLELSHKKLMRNDNLELEHMIHKKLVLAEMKLYQDA